MVIDIRQLKAREVVDVVILSSDDDRFPLGAVFSALIRSRTVIQFTRPDLYADRITFVFEPVDEDGGVFETANSGSKITFVMQER